MGSPITITPDPQGVTITPDRPWSNTQNFNDPFGVLKSAGTVTNDVGNPVTMQQEGESDADTIKRATSRFKALLPQEQQSQMDKEMATAPHKVLQTLSAAAGIGIGGPAALAGAGELGAAAPLLPPLVKAGAKAGLKLVQSHPIATMAAIEAAKQLPGMAGKIAGKIPSWLPLIAGAPEAEAGSTPVPPIKWNPEAEAAPTASIPPVKWNPQTQQPELTAAPPLVRWPQAMEPQQTSTSTAPPPLRWADKEPAQALEDIKAAAAESPQVQTLPVKSATQPPFPGPQTYNVTRGSDPFTHPNSPAKWEFTHDYSSNVEQYGYHPDSQTISVKYPKGSVYQFKATPQMYENMKKAPSVGGYIHDVLEPAQTSGKGAYVGTVARRTTPGQQVKDALSGGQSQ